MTDKYCIENDFAAQKESAEMERSSIDEQWKDRLELNALRARAERAEAKLANWQDDINAVLKQRDDLHFRVARLEEALKTISSLYWIDAPAPEEMREIARRALEEK